MKSHLPNYGKAVEAITIVVYANPGLPVFFCASISVTIVGVESGRLTQRRFVVSETGEKIVLWSTADIHSNCRPSVCVQVRRSISEINRTSIQDWLKELKRWAFLIANISSYSCCLS